MNQDKNMKIQKCTKIIKTKIIVKPNYIGNKNLADAFTEIIIRTLEKRKTYAVKRGKAL